MFLRLVGLKRGEGIIMTNREWMQSLTDKELAYFLTLGLPVKDIRFKLDGYGMFPISINTISPRSISSHLGVEEWLKQEQEFEVVK